MFNKRRTIVWLGTQFEDTLSFNWLMIKASQLAKMKKSIPDLSLS